MTGVVTSCALDRLKDHRPARNAIVVDRLLAAGAIIIGKTNVPEGAGDFQTYNPLYGTSSNPWNTAHSPGGSSGGSAGALAAGFTPIEVRVPLSNPGWFPTLLLSPGSAPTVVPDGERHRGQHPNAGALLRRGGSEAIARSHRLLRPRATGAFS